MEIEYDPAKNERNVRERGLSFERARDFEFATAKINRVFRNGEFRLFGAGYLDDRFHVISYKQTDAGIRVISFRKGNEREAAKNGFQLRR